MTINEYRIMKLEDEISTLRRQITDGNCEDIMNQIFFKQNQIDYLKR